jgi:hypothetical protein
MMGMPVGMGMAPGMMMPISMPHNHGHGHSHGHHSMAVPGCCGQGPPKPSKKNDQSEDDPPWTLDYWGQPTGLADDKATAKAYLHQVLNCPSPIVDQGVHHQIKFLVGSA